MTDTTQPLSLSDIRAQELALAAQRKAIMEPKLHEMQAQLDEMQSQLAAVKGAAEALDPEGNSNIRTAANTLTRAYNHLNTLIQSQLRSL